MTRQIKICGGAHTRFGRFSSRLENGLRVDQYTIEKMFCDVVEETLAGADINPSDIDGVWVGSCSPGAFVQQELLAPLALSASAGFRYKPMAQLTAACASGSAAFNAAADAVQAGRAKLALVVGIEKMSMSSTADVAAVLARCSYWPGEGSQGITFPQLFAQLASAYRVHHGISEDQFRKMLACVAAANYRHGAKNPHAHFYDSAAHFTDADQILALGHDDNPVIADPFRLHDCSPISDGAAALLLVAGEHPLAKRASVTVAGRQTSVDQLPIQTRQRAYQLEAAAHASQHALSQAGIQSKDLDLVEVHDCFTSNQLMCLEALGLSRHGEAGQDYLAGHYDDGPCKVNLSGGLKSKGHPVGATGVSMHYLAYRQLIGNPIGAAHDGEPEHAAVLNVGGSGVVNCATVMRRVC